MPTQPIRCTISPTFYLNDLCERANAQRRHEQIRKYLASSDHDTFVLAEYFTQLVGMKAKKLEQGEFDPQFSLCCCDDTFANAMSAAPKIAYVGCIPKGETEKEREEAGREIVRSDAIKDIPEDQLLDFLVNEYNCNACNFTCEHEHDLEAQNKYRAAVVDYLEKAAALAKAKKSPVARLFLEAKFNLMGRHLDYEEDVSRISYEAAKNAFNLSAKAHVELWLDVSLRELKPLRVRRAKSSKRKS